MKIKGFSLIELMVVVAIIGVLASVASVSYTNYMNTAKIANAITVIQQLHQATMDLYTRGQSISSVPFAGITFNDNQQNVINQGSVYQAQYLASGDGYVGANEWMWCVTVTGLNFPTYSDPKVGCSHCRICSKTLISGSGPNTALFKNLCGVWDSSSSAEIPQQYLPPGCNCASVSGEAC